MCSLNIHQKGKKMHKIQILLEEWQYENLKIISQEKGMSISAVIREIVTDFIGENSPRTALDSICAFGEDSAGCGKDHDKLL